MTCNGPKEKKRRTKDHIIGTLVMTRERVFYIIKHIYSLNIRKCAVYEYVSFTRILINRHRLRLKRFSG